MGHIALLAIQVCYCKARKSKLMMIVNRRDQKIKALGDSIARQELRLKEWATKQRAEWEEKSFPLRQGTIGFRPTRESVRPAEGETDLTVLARLRKLIKRNKEKWKAYVRTKEEIDRQQIFKDTRPETLKLTAGDLEKMGVVIEKGEVFYADPKIERAQ